MSGSRITKLITFDLKDRGRKFTGQDRSNVDLKTWVDLINSPQTQETISTGGMFGYYGHQIRQLFGMYPPETAVLENGKTVKISPALRTVELSATDDGIVSHRVEFLETPEGEHAYRQYKAKVGGFSIACDFKNMLGRIFPTIMGGFDYVLQQNYVYNTSNGLFDNAVPMPDIVKTTLEISLGEMYDCIHQSNYAEHLTETAAEQMLQAAELENRFIAEMAKEAKKKELQKKQQQSFYDSALCPTQSFESFLEQSNQFLNAQSSSEDSSKPKKTATKVIGGMFNWF